MKINDNCLLEHSQVLSISSSLSSSNFQQLFVFGLSLSRGRANPNDDFNVFERRKSHNHLIFTIFFTFSRRRRPTARICGFSISNGRKEVGWRGWKIIMWQVGKLFDVFLGLDARIANTHSRSKKSETCACCRLKLVDEVCKITKLNHALKPKPPTAAALAFVQSNRDISLIPLLPPSLALSLSDTYINEFPFFHSESFHLLSC